MLKSGRMTTEDKDDDVGSGFSFSFPLKTGQTDRAVSGRYSFERLSAAKYEDLPEGVALVQPFIRVLQEGGYISSTGALQTFLCHLR